MTTARPPFPPFTAETAAQKARLAEDAWNRQQPAQVALAYTEASQWRNRAEIFSGRAAIVALSHPGAGTGPGGLGDFRKWAFTENRIAVRFAYEWHDDTGQWFRSYGNENWQFDEHGLMAERHASINDLPIRADQRLFHWPLGVRPADHPSLSDLGL